MHPLDASIPRHQCGAGKLQHVAVLLKSSFQTDGKARSLGRSSAPAAFGRREEDGPPVGAFETHRTVALPLGVCDANRRYAVPPAEARHLLGCPLDDAAHSDAALVEPRQRLAQLRECLRIKRSTKMTQPEDECGPAGPQFREKMRLSGSARVSEFRDGIPFGRRVSHLRISLHRNRFYPNAKCARCRSLNSLKPGHGEAGSPALPGPFFPLALLQERM